MSIAEVASEQSQKADQDVIKILLNAPNVQQKGTADARYQWPTVVFEKVCICKGNYWGVSCGECKFGWTGNDCSTKKTPVVRRSFSTLSTEDKQAFVNATIDLKKEMGVWSVVIEEPANYSSGTVKLQDVSTYDFFVYLHNNVARDSKCNDVNGGVRVDFGHSGPVFPVWHRYYLLLLEREFQRIMGDDTFGLPYWEWEQNDRSPFSKEYYGVPSNVYGPAENVTGDLINPEDWHVVCDLIHRDDDADCASLWKPCIPVTDLAARRPLQRGGKSTYLPNIVEVMIALAAPLYDAKDDTGRFSRDSPRESFRSRMEGRNTICSASVCVGPRDISRLHNNIHLWVGGHLSKVPAAVNDPVFNIHHANVDRVLESWMQRFTPTTLPSYVPERDGHPGHNHDDFMVPYFPLITAGEQYKLAEEWGYVYDSLISAGISDDAIKDCDDINICPTCDANGTCIDCDYTCPEPGAVVIILPTPPPSDTDEDDEDDSGAVEPALGLGLGIPLLITIVIIAILLIIIFVLRKRSSFPGKDKGVEMTTKT